MYCVDYFTAESLDYSEDMTNQYGGKLFDEFRSNIIHSQTYPKVKVVRGETKASAKYFHENNIKADLIYVDAGHSREEVLADLETYLPLLTGPKVFCGDDYGAPSPADGTFPVKEAVDEFTEKHGLKLHLSNNWFWYVVVTGDSS